MTLHTLQVGMGSFAELPGGLNRVYANLVRELVAQGVDVHGIVTGSPAVARESGGVVVAAAETTAPFTTRLRAIRSAAAAWLRTHDTDTVVASHFALNAYPLLGTLGTRPFVVHFHGPWAEESAAEGGSRLSVLAKSMIERSVYNRADAFIVLSRAFADVLVARFGVKRARIHIVPGGVEVGQFTSVPSRAECRAQLGWPADRPIVLAVRRLVRRVGVDVLIEAAVDVRQRVPNALILIAGSGPLRDELSARIGALGLDDTVRLLGFVADEDLPAAYRAADLSVVPTQALEGFGLITVESLAAGTPCIVTPVGGLPDVVAPLDPRLVARSTSSAHVADAVAGALLGEWPLPSSERCTAYAREHFDWPVIAARTRQIYEGLLA